jgi:poly-gamma-glutamate capsule biosynthesis protein CapA/YwtB (metallophosphatase superfamily)
LSDPVSIAIMGDVFPNARFFKAGVPLSDQFSSTLAKMHQADLRTANFLMPLSERGTPTEKLANIRANPDIAADVEHLKLDVVSLANNHILDYGPVALNDTQAALKEAGIVTIGAGETLDAAMAPAILEVKETRIAIAAYSCLVPPGAAATSERCGISPIRVLSSYEVNAQWAIEEPGEPEMVRIRTWCDPTDANRAVGQVASLREQVDAVVVSLHWGYGASDELADYQVPLAHALVDAGADAILGHHVHAVQGVEVYGGKPIIYSSGTFIGRQVPEDPANLTELAARLIAAMSPDGILARLWLDTTGVQGLELLPTTLDEHGLPVIGLADTNERVARRIRRLSKRFGTNLTLRDDCLVVGL